MQALKWYLRAAARFEEMFTGAGNIRISAPDILFRKMQKNLKKHLTNENESDII